MINSGNATMLDTTTENLFSDIGLNSSIGLDNYTSNAIGGNGDITTPGPIRDGDGNIICEGPSEEEYMFYVTFAWWLEGFGQILVGSLGELSLFNHLYIKIFFIKYRHVSLPILISLIYSYLLFSVGPFKFEWKPGVTAFLVVRSTLAKQFTQQVTILLMTQWEPPTARRLQCGISSTASSPAKHT